MKRCAVLIRAALAAVVMAALGLHSAGAGPPAVDPAEEIRALELAHNQAIVHGDVSALDGVTSDDYTFITQRGFLITKPQMLRGLANGAFRYEYRQVYDLRIRVYGDAAVVTGRSLHTGQQNGKDYSDAYRFTRVYVRQKGRWLSVAWQVTSEDDLARKD